MIYLHDFKEEGHKTARSEWLYLQILDVSALGKRN